MSNHWLCLYRTDKSIYPDINEANHYLNMLNQSESEKTYHLVPITKHNGEKDLYQYSDLLYYGNSLWYRRFLSKRILLILIKVVVIFQTLLRLEFFLTSDLMIFKNLSYI